MNKRILAVIPARYASTRLPAKPLADINGRPLIYYVWKAASTAKLIDRLIVATDDERIKNACVGFGAEAIITPPDLPSGSDRVLNVLNQLKDEYDYVMNIQGDEPLITGELLDNLILKTIESNADVGTVITKISNNEELFDPNSVKVVIGNKMKAIYFSRSPVPYMRDIPATKWLDNDTYWKHIGLYLYSSITLRRFGELPASRSERTEKLEQLRLLDDGAVFVCCETELNLLGIDTPEDLAKFRKIIEGL